jgi:hypothetical protein
VLNFSDRAFAEYFDNEFGVGIGESRFGALSAFG